MLTDVLHNLGFTDKEAAIYMACIRSGTAAISEIAKRAQLPRSTGYNVLMKLNERGIVKHFSKGNKMLFSALSPNELVDFLKNKKEKVTDQMELLKTYLPQFEALINPNLSLPKVSFHEGIKGVQFIYQDILKKTKAGEETKAWITLSDIDPELKDWLYNKFTPKKVSKKIKSKVILSSPKSSHYRKLDKKHLRETRAIPYGQFPFKVEVDLYGKNRIAIVSFASNDLFGLIIESENIYQTLNSMFSFMWIATK
ncbi:MAG: helix-turn-helix domain-containing protein [Candidatus Gracilibacteria bacterium]|nr:helix-turn-helix domain-containing protein [Candidatus Gracilibacteria bacterium]